jgi:hypothetical protein
MQERHPSAYERPATGRSPIAIAGALAGALLFVYALYVEGAAEIVGRLRGIGAGFVVVLALSAFRMAVRAKAWSLCVDPETGFTFRDAFAAFVSGDAVGNLSPLGPFVSESTKALLSRRHLPTSTAVSSVVLENIFYSMSVAVMVSIGTVSFLLGFRPQQGALTITAAIAAVAGAGVLTVWWLLATQPRVLSRFLRHEAVRRAEETIFAFVATRRQRVGRIVLLEFAFHAASVAETFFLLVILVGGIGRMPLIALVMATVERLITIVFKFVPLRIGVDQVGSAQVAAIMGIGSGTGVALATVRTARNLVWAMVGLLLLFKSGMSVKAAVTESR